MSVLSLSGEYLRVPRFKTFKRFTQSGTVCMDVIRSSDLDLVFPPAQPITQEITAFGIDLITATAYSDCYLSAASKLRERCKYFVGRSIKNIHPSTCPRALEYQSTIRKRYFMLYNYSCQSWKKLTLEQFRPQMKSGRRFKVSYPHCYPLTFLTVKKPMTEIPTPSTALFRV